MQMLLLITGLIGLLLLPAGTWLGTTSILFQGLSVLHLAALLAASASAIRELLTRAKDNSEQFKVIFIVLWIIVLIVFCLHPVTARDALTHHLAVPKIWLEQGAIVAIPWHSWSFYPMLANLAYVSLLHWGLEPLTAIYQLLMLICLSGLVSKFLSDICNAAELSTSGFFVTISLPALIKLSTIPLVDVSLACYMMLAIYLLMRGIHNENRRTIGLAGVACGLALGTKYNALLACVTLGLALLWLLTRRKLTISRICSTLLILGGAAFVVYLPWLLRNYGTTGNPIYPLFQSKLGGPVLPGATALISPLASRLLVYGESPLDYLLLPLRMIFLGQDDSPKYFDGVLSPLCILALIPLFKTRGRDAISFIALFSALYFIFAVLSAGPRIRYLSPIFGPLCVLTTLGLGEFSRFKSILLAAYLGFSIYYTTKLAASENLFNYLSAKISRSEYLTQQVPDWALINFVNTELPKNSKVYLVLTGNAFYYFNTEVRSAGHFSASEIIAWTNSANTAAELKEQLASRDLTHIAAHVVRLTETLTVSLAPEKALLWNNFVQQELEQTWTDGRFVVWKLR